jgi:alpha-glucosidase
LSIGSYIAIDDVPEGCFAYVRELDERRFLIVLNCTTQDLKVTLPRFGEGHIVLSTYLNREGHVDLSAVDLPANEGYVIKLS